MFAHIYHLSFAPLLIAEDKGALIKVEFCQKIPLMYQDIETPLLKEAATQLQEYFSGRRQIFNLPLSPRGTPFQQKVWQALQTIPYGQTRSYQDIAIQINEPKACRAVGQANHYNPLAIVIPCHRVIGKSGRLTGYAGGLNIKTRLLQLEQGSLDFFKT